VWDCLTIFIEKQHAEEGRREEEYGLVRRGSDSFGTAIPFGSTMNHKPGRSGRLIEEKKMEGLLFLIFWIGGATLHTVFDLKIKPLIQANEETLP
jgi:hypothetical protein